MITLVTDFASDHASWFVPGGERCLVATESGRCMCAADLLVTKAGPSTISEALGMGLPMVLSGALPGQERPNVEHVMQGSAGVWAASPIGAAEAVQDLLSFNNQMLAQLSERAQELAGPSAAWRIAEIVWSSANRELS